MNRVSITIVAYHNYDDIKNAIRTIEHYTDKELKKHIYIVDNGFENDVELRDLFEFLEKFKDVEYLNPGKNLGFGKGHNYVIDMLDSDYHAIVNPDILLKEDSLSKIIDFLDNDSSIGMCIPKLIDETGAMQLAYRKDPTVFDMFIRTFCKGIFLRREKEHTLQDMDYTKPFQVPFAQGSFLVVRTEIFKKLNGFDDNFFMYLEDADLCRRLNQISRLMYFPDTEVIHKWERGSHKNKELFKHHMNSMRYYFKKWGWKFL